MVTKPATRRQFLKTVGAFGAASATGFAANLASFNAFAADTSGYKALVCVFLFGGLDCHDLVIPYDQTSYNAWRDKRQALLGGYADNGRDRGNLLPLAGANLGGREFAFGPELGALQPLFASGDLAVLGNVGPLIEPLTRTTFQSGSGRRPGRLFSHNDQQSTWMASAPEGAQFGWGGRLADMVLAAGANTRSTFTSVSVSGNAVFLSGEQARQFRVSSNGAIQLAPAGRGFFQGSSSIPGLMDDHYRDADGVLNNLFERDIVAAQRFAMDANADLDTALETAPTFTTPFPETRLGGQMRVVAQMIAQRDLLGARRQVFFVAQGGFDSHSNQANAVPGRMGEVSDAMRALYDATAELGIANSVTSFTASDFGRTLQVNGDGTDHGWGAHHLVLGGAVNGGQILGDIPESVFEHELDSGRGRLIPSSSVEQYAASLGRWFGLNDSELVDALPALPNFNATALNGLFT